MLQSVSKCFKMFQNVFKMLQSVSQCFKMPQSISDVSKSVQNASKYSKVFKSVSSLSRCFKVLYHTVQSSQTAIHNKKKRIGLCIFFIIAN